ncbi:MAG TPA: hypothetical protein VLF93_03210 [Candidatus Saccharimonadales bacterium]|nr:hypothetical protein [Candidatus Saccharimonadales bacterium]
MEWLDENLKTKIKTIFEPRYKRPLSEQEIFEIAINLSIVIEDIIKFKWKEKYESKYL